MARSNESFAVLGLSTFGYRVATRLFALGASVIAIDIDDGRVQKIAPSVTKAFRADALDFDVLDHIGVFDCDTVVFGFRETFDAAVLLTHELTRRNDRCRIVAQVDTEEKGEALRVMGADVVVFPEKDMADRLVTRLTTPNLVEEIPLFSDTAIVEVVVPENFVGRSLIDLEVRSRYQVQVVGIKSKGKSSEDIVIAPPADRPFRSGDIMLVLGKKADLQRFSAVSAASPGSAAGS